MEAHSIGAFMFPFYLVHRHKDNLNVVSFDHNYEAVSYCVDEGISIRNIQEIKAPWDLEEFLRN